MIHATAHTKWIVISLALALMANACVGGEGEAEGEADEAAERVGGEDRVILGPDALASLPLTYADAQVVELVPSLEVPAEVMPDPNRVSIIGSSVAGRVVDVRATVGDEVRAGTPLVVLESVEVGEAVSAYQAAVADATVAANALVRAERLFQDRIVPQRRLEEARATHTTAQAGETAAATRLQTLGVQLPLVPGSELGRVHLSSPVGGTVVARAASVGQWVGPSESLLEVMDLRVLWLLASVYERDIRHVEVGQPVLVDVRAYPGEVFEGEIALVEGRLDEDSRSVPVRVVLSNEDRRLRPGMFATARITGTHAHEPEELLAIPTAAVQEVDGHTSVFVREADGSFVLQRVHLGERAGDQVEVLNGLVEGAQVVVEGSFVLKGHLLRGSLAEEEGH